VLLVCANEIRRKLGICSITPGPDPDNIPDAYPCASPQSLLVLRPAFIFEELTHRRCWCCYLCGVCRAKYYRSLHVSVAVYRMSQPDCCGGGGGGGGEGGLPPLLALPEVAGGGGAVVGVPLLLPGAGGAATSPPPVAMLVAGFAAVPASALTGQGSSSPHHVATI